MRVTVEGRLIPPTVSSLKGNFVTVRLENRYTPTKKGMELLCTSKHRVWSPKRRLVRNIPETFKGLGLSQQTAFCPQKAMLAGMIK